LIVQQEYGKKFGSEDRVNFITDSNAVDASKLDKSQGHIQITVVTSYFEPWEMRERVTYYDQNNNISKSRAINVLCRGVEWNTELSSFFLGQIALCFPLRSPSWAVAKQTSFTSNLRRKQF
jgi:hypothetical protein